jgi:hypothetical protein
MATIYTSVDVDVDIEIDEFVDSCSDREIQRLIKHLSSEGHLGKLNIIDPSKMTVNEIDFIEMLTLLSGKYHQMSVEETEMIENLYRKYR